MRNYHITNGNYRPDDVATLVPVECRLQWRHTGRRVSVAVMSQHFLRDEVFDELQRLAWSVIIIILL